MARAGLTGESHARNDDVEPMRLAQTMVIDRTQLAVYCLSNSFAGKSLTCFAPSRDSGMGIKNGKFYTHICIGENGLHTRFVCE